MRRPGNEAKGVGSHDMAVNVQSFNRATTASPYAVVTNKFSQNSAHSILVYSHFL